MDHVTDAHTLRIRSPSHCVSQGTEKEHVLISVGLGIFAGGVALWILKVGIFLGGSCLGLFISLAMRTSLAHMNV